MSDIPTHTPLTLSIKCNPGRKKVVSLRVSQFKYLPLRGSILKLVGTLDSPLGHMDTTLYHLLEAVKLTYIKVVTTSLLSTISIYYDFSGNQE